MTRAPITSDLAPTGTLRAAINLGNPILAQGTPEAPSGVTVDLAREIGARIGVPVELVCVNAARESYAAITAGQVDICFLAIEPAREEGVTFTAPYVVIEEVFVVPEHSTFTHPTDIDRAGVRVGVRRGAAYDLYLSRTLRQATLVRGDEVAEDFDAQRLDAVAGIRQPMTEFVATHPGFRVLEPRFMEIRQAVGTTKTRQPETVRFLRGLIEELKANGFVAEALRRAQQPEATVAPPEPVG